MGSETETGLPTTVPGRGAEVDSQVDLNGTGVPTQHRGHPWRLEA